MLWLLPYTDVFRPFKAAVCPLVQLLISESYANEISNDKEAAALTPSPSPREPLEDGEIEEHVGEEMSKLPEVPIPLKCSRGWINIMAV